MVPDGLGIDHGDRPVGAGAQAIDFAAVNQRIRAGELKFFEALFEEFPGLQGDFPRRAFWLRLIGTEKNVAFVFFEAEVRYCFREVGWKHYVRAITFLMPVFLPTSNCSYASIGKRPVITERSASGQRC